MLLVVGNEAAPATNKQTIYATAVILLGYIVTAFIFGNMAALMANLNKKDSKFQETIDFVSSTMRSIKLPEKLQDDVLKYLQYVHETPDIQQDLDKFYEQINPQLKK